MEERKERDHLDLAGTDVVNVYRTVFQDLLEP